MIPIYFANLKLGVANLSRMEEFQVEHVYNNYIVTIANMFGIGFCAVTDTRN